MNGEAVMVFADTWIWLIFVGAGLFFILMELIIGVETGLDLVFIGSALVIGGLISWPLHSWVWSLVITIIICVAYVLALRQFIKRRLMVTKVKTNIDLIIGKKGIVLKDISNVTDGRVQVGSERWRASAEVEIKEGEEITVTGVSGATLIVEKNEGGD